MSDTEYGKISQIAWPVIHYRNLYTVKYIPLMGHAIWGPMQIHKLGILQILVCC